MALLRILDCHVFLVNKNELRQELFIVNASRKSARGKQKGPSLFFCSIDMNLNENPNWNKNLCKMKYSFTMVLIFLSINSIFMIRPKRQRHLCTMVLENLDYCFVFVVAAVAFIFLLSLQKPEVTFIIFLTRFFISAISKLWNQQNQSSIIELMLHF